MSILPKGSYALKKEALVNLVKHEETREKALEYLFSIPSPFGLKNKQLRKHIQLAGETTMEEARDHIYALSQKKDLWHRKVRKDAKRVLEKLDGRKN